MESEHSTVLSLRTAGKRCSIFGRGVGGAVHCRTLSSISGLYPLC